MAGFMNKELEMIRNNLLCGYCGKHFKGSDSQARNVKYQKREVYCSDPCRHTAIAKKNSTPIPSRGPCKTCGKPFSSRTAKIYCSLACYVKSDQFKAMQTENMENNKSPERRAKMAASLRTGEMVKCLECGEETYSKRGRKRRFCSTSCYRAYMAKRFDRWAANPANIALPQGYDEFLDQEELPCVVEGCNWQGKHLSLHINRAHGIIKWTPKSRQKSSEFKLHIRLHFQLDGAVPIDLFLIQFPSFCPEICPQSLPRRASRSDMRHPASFGPALDGAARCCKR